MRKPIAILLIGFFALLAIPVLLVGFMEPERRSFEWVQLEETGFKESGLRNAKQELKLRKATEGQMHSLSLMQRFRPAASGQFALLGTVDIVIAGHVLPPEEAGPLRPLVLVGVAMHPSEVPWASWLVHKGITVHSSQTRSRVRLIQSLKRQGR